MSTPTTPVPTTTSSSGATPASASGSASAKAATTTPNFLATEAVERSTSVGSSEFDFEARVSPNAFARALAHVGADQLVLAMNEAVSTSLGDFSQQHQQQEKLQQQQEHQQQLLVQQLSQEHRSASQVAEMQQQMQYQHQQQLIQLQHHQQQTQRGEDSIQQQQQRHHHHHHHQQQQQTGGAATAAATGGTTTFEKLSQASSSSSYFPPTPVEYHHHNQQEPGGPVVARLRHSPSRHKQEHLRNSAIVEGDDRAIIAIPPRVDNDYDDYDYGGNSRKKNKNSNSMFPATPDYWQNRGEGKWHVRHRGITTPAVPRPDLEDEMEEKDAAYMKRKREKDEVERKKEEKNQEQIWKSDLKKRVTALSEHYRRQFQTTSAQIAGSDALEEDVPPDQVVPSRLESDLVPPASQTPSERVYKSRSIRMSAAEHNIIKASPELKDELAGKPRIRSPYGNLLSVTELDHFVPSVHMNETASLLATPSSHNVTRRGPSPVSAASGSAAAATVVGYYSSPVTNHNNNQRSISSYSSSSSSQQRLRGNDLIEQTLYETDLANADRSYRRVDRLTHQKPRNVAGAEPVRVGLERARSTEADRLSSPQYSAMLESLLKQREGANNNNGAGNTVVDINDRRGLLLNDT